MAERWVLITGASSGIGRATALEFAKSGHNLILTARRKEKLATIKSKIEEDFKVNIKTLSFDIRIKAEVELHIDALLKEGIVPHILVNNAGLAKGFDTIQEGNIEDWETMIDTNIKGLLYITRLLLPAMINLNSGHIINIASTAARDVYPKGNVYCASKAAVNMLTQGMRIDLHTHNIRVSQVSPGHVEDTEFALTRFDGNSEKANIYSDFTPLNSTDVAEIIHFIATRKKHINIQDVLVMGSQQAGSNFIDRSGRT